VAGQPSLMVRSTSLESLVGVDAQDQRPAIPGAVNRHEDRTLGMTRIEITCAACGGHLGHVFKGEGFPNPSTSSKLDVHRPLSQ